MKICHSYSNRLSANAAKLNCGTVWIVGSHTIMELKVIGYLRSIQVCHYFLRDKVDYFSV